MKKLVLILCALVLAGCGGGGGGGGGSLPGSGDVVVRGNIYNADPVTGASMDLGLNMAAAAAAPNHLGAVSRGQMIMVSIEVQNKTAAALKDLRFEIKVEDATFLTPEFWRCWKEWSYPYGKVAVEVWTEYAEPLPACTGEPKDESFVCENHPAGLDCANPTYRVEYTPPGDGFWTATGGPINITPGATWGPSTSGFGNGGIDVRPDHRAFWIVKDAQGNIIAEKQYLFDVVP